MKKIIVLLASSVVFFAGAAFAEGCHYGKSEEFANASPAVEQEITDPKLLALLKKQNEEAKEVLKPVFN
jgi:hypothetical protein